MVKSLARKRYEELKKKCDDIQYNVSEDTLKKISQQLSTIRNDESNIYYIDSSGGVFCKDKNCFNKQEDERKIFINTYSNTEKKFFLCKKILEKNIIYDNGSYIEYDEKTHICEKGFYDCGEKKKYFIYNNNALYDNKELQIKQKDKDQMLCYFQYINGKNNNGQELSNNSHYEGFYKYKYQDKLSYHFDYRDGKNGDEKINEVIKNKDSFKDVKQLNIIIDDHGVKSKESEEIKFDKFKVNNFIDKLNEIVKYCNNLRVIKINILACYGAYIDNEYVNLFDKLKEFLKEKDIKICLIKNKSTDKYDEKTKMIKNDITTISSKIKKNDREKFIIEKGELKECKSFDEYRKAIKSWRNDDGEKNNDSNKQPDKLQEEWKGVNIILLILLSFTIIGGIIYYLKTNRELENNKKINIENMKNDKKNEKPQSDLKTTKEQKNNQSLA